MCGSELVAARMATEMSIEYRYLFCMFGVRNDGPALLLGDNEHECVEHKCPLEPA